jgi:hypothetical protein
MHESNLLSDAVRWFVRILADVSVGVLEAIVPASTQLLGAGSAHIH